MISLRQITLCAFLIAAICGCNEEFSPKGTFHEEMVLYSVFSNTTDTVFARVYRTYDPPGFDPFEHATDNPVMDAVVTVTAGTTSIQFRDTIIQRTDQSRYPTDIQAFVLHPFTVVPGSQYSVNVQSGTAGSVTATTTVPGIGVLNYENRYVLQDPSLTSDFFLVSINLTPQAWAFMARLSYHYEVSVNGQWIPDRIAVPVKVQDAVDCVNFVAEYPQLVRRRSPTIAGGSAILDFVLYQNEALRLAIRNARHGYDPDSLRFTKASVELIQVDRALYSYLSLTGGFRDPFSIRTDDPDFTNVTGGGGMVGSFVSQVDEFVVPADLGKIWSCE